jgi:peptidoglycan/xylan/chitin deacetylase (PgdA/CDA1 family)
MGPLATATQGKGFLKMLRRARVISSRYGITQKKMERTLTHFTEILSEFNCGATFPITAVTLPRRKGFLEKVQKLNIEFAVHGKYHIDHTRLSREELVSQIDQARRSLKDYGLACTGFRSPYLRWNEDSLAAIRQTGCLYDSSQAIAWEAARELGDPSYRRALDFYGALPAEIYPSLPWLDDGLIRIPYSLPDDEALIERLRFDSPESMEITWLGILAETHRLGELFTLGLHPERIYLLERALRKTLSRARQFSPAVWIARLDEIARWWQARMDTRTTITMKGDKVFSLHVKGPEGCSVLLRGVEAITETKTWEGNNRLAYPPVISFRSPLRPFIGVSRDAPPALSIFLLQQGFIFEQAADDQAHPIFLADPHFSREDERPLLARIEQGDFPLVRLNRWPNTAKSALCVTGDIDALTIWDYGQRFLGR